jgi:hypothetical protein
MYMTKTFRIIIYIAIYFFVCAGFLAMKIYFKLEDGMSYNRNEFRADIPGALIMGIAPVFIPIAYFFFLSKRKKNTGGGS